MLASLVYNECALWGERRSRVVLDSRSHTPDIPLIYSHLRQCSVYVSKIRSIIERRESSCMSVCDDDEYVIHMSMSRVYQQYILQEKRVTNNRTIT